MDNDCVSTGAVPTVIIAPDAHAAGALVADRVEELLRDVPDAVLGLATGATPLPAYEELVARYAAGRVSFARARAFLLDEYVGLASDDHRSFHSTINRALVSRVDLRAGEVHVPNGRARSLTDECAAYEEAIAAAGGVDLQLLGLGTNGHVAFNEPGSPFDSRTRVVRLAEQTRRDNARLFGGDARNVPTHAVSQGLGTIHEARSIILVATGTAKAKAVRELLGGPQDRAWPVRRFGTMAPSPSSWTPPPPRYLKTWSRMSPHQRSSGRGYARASAAAKTALVVDATAPRYRW